MDEGDEVILIRFRKRKSPRPPKTDGQTDPHHFSELITPQVQPLQLRQLLHAPANTCTRWDVKKANCSLYAKSCVERVEGSRQHQKAANKQTKKKHFNWCFSKLSYFSQIVWRGLRPLREKKNYVFKIGKCDVCSPRVSPSLWISLHTWLSYQQTRQKPGQS